MEDFPAFVLGDRFCTDTAALHKLSNAYNWCLNHLNPGDPRRSNSVLNMAAGLRFIGDWSAARQVLQAEPAFGMESRDPWHLLLDVENLSLEFELGLTNGVYQRSLTILREALETTNWLAAILAHRQLGMILQERGAYKAAREHHQLAYHYSNELRRTSALL